MYILGLHTLSRTERKYTGTHYLLYRIVLPNT